VKNLRFELSRLRNQTKLQKYWKILYLTTPVSLSFLVILPVLLAIFRLLNSSLYSPNTVQIFWNDSYFRPYALAILIALYAFPIILIPCYLWLFGGYQSYKHLLVSKQETIRLILIFLSPIVSWSLSYKTLPGFIIFVSSQGYLLPLYSLTAILLTQVASILTITGTPLSHIFRPQLRSVSLPSLIGFTYLRPCKDKAINLDVGAFSPRLKVVISELKIWHSLVENSAPTSRDIWHYAQGVHNNISPNWLSKTGNLLWKGVNDLRIEIASIIKLSQRNIIFVSSTTRAIQIALEALRPGSIVTTNFEHPTENCLMESSQKKYGTEIFKVEVKDNNDLNSWKTNFTNRFVKECVDRQASVALISHVSSINGWILPIEEICHQLSIQSPATSIIIDGAHAIGNIDLDLSQIPFTFYAFSGHKWLFSSVNIGILVVSDSVLNNLSTYEKLKQEIHESLSIHEDNPIDNDESNSSINVDAMVSLSASVKLLNQAKLEYVIDNMASLKKHFCKAASNYNSFKILDESVTRIPIVPGILNIQSKNTNLSYNELKVIENKLEQKYGVIVNAIKSPSQNFPDVIRVCLPFYLWEHEVRKAVNAINKAFS
jgi:selenocysteine lyase/cysteine desulfurase